jgi:hypothetical protein
MNLKDDQQSCLTLVDLAGYENVNTTTKSKDKEKLKIIKETNKINHSLDTFKEVIQTIRQNSIKSGQMAVPYKKSKLTMLLMQHFIEEHNILMIVNINPRKEDLQEAIKSLEFASIMTEIVPTISNLVVEKPSEVIDLNKNLNAGKQDRKLSQSPPMKEYGSEIEKIKNEMVVQSSKIESRIKDWQSSIFKKMSEFFLKLSSSPQQESIENNELKFLRGKRSRTPLLIKADSDSENNDKNDPENSRNPIFQKEIACQTDHKNSPTLQHNSNFELISKIRNCDSLVLSPNMKQSEIDFNHGFSFDHTDKFKTPKKNQKDVAIRCFGEKSSSEMNYQIEKKQDQVGMNKLKNFDGNDCHNNRKDLFSTTKFPSNQINFNNWDKSPTCTTRMNFNQNRQILTDRSSSKTNHNSHKNTSSYYQIANEKSDNSLHKKYNSRELYRPKGKNFQGPNDPNITIEEIDLENHSNFRNYRNGNGYYRRNNQEQKSSDNGKKHYKK